MPTTKTSQRPLVSLALPRRVATLITYAGQILEAMTGNPSFSSPSPTLAVVQQAVGKLQTAEASALARTKGAVQARDNERTALVKLLQLLGNYVQSIADADAETAEAVIKSAGLSVRKVPTRNPRVFAASQGAVSGSAKIVTRSAGPRTAYEWQYSIDGGKTWVDLPGTVKASTTVTGIAAGTTAMFRYRTLAKTGQSDWAAPVSLLVK
jgi:hypothetical protein